MNSLKSFRFFYTPVFIGSISIALIQFFFLWLNDYFSLDLNEDLLMFWLPGLLAVLLYLFFLLHRLEIILRNVNEKAWVLHLLPILLLILSGFGFGKLYSDLNTELIEVKNLADIDFNKKRVKWKYIGNTGTENQIYEGNFTEYTSGRHPKTKYISYAVIHLKPANIWVITSKSESITSSSEQSEKQKLSEKIRSECFDQALSISESLTDTHYLTSVRNGEDLEYSIQTLKDLAYQDKIPTKFYTHEDEFKPGIQETTQWLLVITLICIFLFYTIASIFGKNHLVELKNSPSINLTIIQWLAYYPKQVPITATVITITFLFLIIELANDPNIFSVKAFPYISKWFVSNTILESDQWYRILTYPFTNYFIYFKALDILIFVFIGYELETKMKKSGMVLLLVTAQIAGGLAAIYFDDQPNCGLTVFTFALVGYYLMSGAQKHIGFDNTRLICLTILIFGLGICVLLNELEYQKMIAATLVGFMFGFFLPLRKVLD